ncbi:uncharacterized protein RCC_00120 [Ramularia collo-cygni]|uniref:Uncharacterized protein n=1 Tax=Ramularia collo-cygni TaxID=112498 RepID=A0A2D3URN6_9PEZI|nr:uncharacterized protein RCC_00120 [Ramularia collo-cygni]CZT14147.1 uncharacterized protein RCC_00120 [Ramularia collo-cygni]
MGLVDWSFWTRALVPLAWTSVTTVMLVLGLKSEKFPSPSDSSEHELLKLLEPPAPSYEIGQEKQRKQEEDHKHEQEKCKLQAELYQAVREYDLKVLKVNQAHELAMRQQNLAELEAKHVMDMTARKQEAAELEAKHVMDIAIRKQDLLELETKHAHKMALQTSKNEVAETESWSPLTPDTETQDEFHWES